MSGCVKCGAPTPNRKCRECSRMDRAEEAARIAQEGFEEDDADLQADGGRPFCASCTARVAREDRVTLDGQISHRQCAPDDVDRGDGVRTDGGSFEELNALERRADALEEIAEQQRIQNAVLFELARTPDHRLPELRDHLPEEPTMPRSGRSLAGWVEDGALDLDEQVDLNAVDRATEGSR